MKKNDTVQCVDAEFSVPLLHTKEYIIESVSMCDYIWLVDKNHTSKRIGPYSSTRFVSINN